MSDAAQFFCFRDGSLQLVTSPPESEVVLSVADSWLVDEGRVRNLQAHFSRFGDWVRNITDVCDEQLQPFFDAVREAIPNQGRWFPRIEFHGEAIAPNHLFLRLREAPEQLGPITLWTYPETDPRHHPTVKGPDLSLCLQVRRAAQMHGADEAVLLSDEGFIAEGALSSLVWWRGDVLCAPGYSINWLPSVTRSLVFEIAKQCDTEVHFEEAKPESLIGCEIWLLSALNGIRPVTSWVNLGGELGEPTHIDSFSKRLSLFRVQLG